MSGFGSEFIQGLLEDDPLGLLRSRAKATPATAEDRLRASFREIVDFVRAHGREPSRKTTDINERRLAIHLQAIAGDEDQHASLRELDAYHLLRPTDPPSSIEDALDDDPFGLLSPPASGSGDAATDIFTLTNVPSRARSVASVDDRAEREPCPDFDAFREIFTNAQVDLRSGRRRLITKTTNPNLSWHGSVGQGKLFVVSGMLAYVAEEGERSKDATGRINSRLRVVFENGTQSRLLRQSFAVSLSKNQGRLVSEPEEVTLRRINLDPATKMGSVYVLRSLSSNPLLARYPEAHKIGSTARSVEERTASAITETTFLNGEVKIVAVYEMAAVAAPRIERALHRFFSEARLDVWFEHGDMSVVEAREWFDVPIAVIDEAIQLLQVESLPSYRYNRDLRQLVFR